MRVFSSDASLLYGFRLDVDSRMSSVEVEYFLDARSFIRGLAKCEDWDLAIVAAMMPYASGDEVCKQAKCNKPIFLCLPDSTQRKDLGLDPRIILVSLPSRSDWLNAQISEYFSSFMHNYNIHNLTY